MLKKPGLLSLNEIAGATVYDPIGVRIGQICQILLDPVAGRIIYALMLFDFPDAGQDERPIPWSALNYSTARGTFHSFVTQRQVLTAPQYDAGGDSDPELERSLARHYSS